MLPSLMCNLGCWVGNGCLVLFSKDRWVPSGQKLINLLCILFLLMSLMQDL